MQCEVEIASIFIKTRSAHRPRAKPGLEIWGLRGGFHRFSMYVYFEKSQRDAVPHCRTPSDRVGHRNLFVLVFVIKMDGRFLTALFV